MKIIPENKPKQAFILILASLMTVTMIGCQTTTPVNSFDNRKTAPEPKTPQEIAKIRTTLAGQYIRERKLDTAKRQLEKAFAADRRYAPAYDMMGVLLQQEGSQVNMKAAERYFVKAIRLDETFMQARNNYGVYLSQMNRNEEAIKQFKVASSALGYEKRIAALENLGRTYMKIGNEQKAISVFARALENDNNSLIARIELIDLLIKSNQIPKAQKLFDELGLILRNRQLSSRILLQGAKLAVHSGDFQTREKYIQKLLSSYPLSQEAKQVKVWLKDRNATWR